MSAAAVVLDLGRVRAHRWMLRAGLGELVDRRPGGSPVHGLLPAEEAEILAVFEQWAEIDRSHRKLAHRGSYLHRFWASPSTVRRVLSLHDKHFRPLPRPGRSHRRPFPEWAEYRPNSIWIYDTTHFTRPLGWPPPWSRTWCPGSGWRTSCRVRRPTVNPASEPAHSEPATCKISRIGSIGSRAVAQAPAGCVCPPDELGRAAWRLFGEARYTS